MRSIGKRNIEKLKQICKEEKAKGYGGLQLRDAIEARVPSEWYNIWESAEAEIQRIIDDEYFAS